MTGRAITTHTPARHPASYVDPHGFLFEEGGRLYRAIYRDSAAHVQALLQADWFRAAAGEGIVETSIADATLADPDCPLVLEHARVWPVTYAPEWPAAMLRDAAVHTLDLALTCAPKGLMLQDASPWNVLFEGSRPVFVDVTSIVPADPDTLWPAYEQCQALFLRPLQMMHWGQARAARSLLLNPLRGVTPGDLYAGASALRLARHPGIAASRWVERAAGRQRGAGRKYVVKVTSQVRERFLRSIRQRVAAASQAASDDTWTGYYETDVTAEQLARKQTAIASLLQRLAPATVVDVGANTGAFSRLAADAGARVIAMDASDGSMSRLYEAARASRTPITPIVADALAPTPAFGFAAREFPALLERVRSDVSLFLAVIHHFHITGRQSFSRIASLVDTVSERAAIVEYVDPSDPQAERLPRGRVIRYGMEDVQGALAACFRTITRVPSDRPTRELLVCER